MKKPPFKDKVCRKPFDYLEISSPKEGRLDCYSCCPTILPVKTGDLAQNKLNEIWNSEEYKKLRASIIDESFSHCVHELCPEIQSDNLLDVGQIEDTEILRAYNSADFHLTRGPREINLSYDEVCNLACPSCRNDFITHNSEKDDELLAALTTELLEMDLSNTRLIVCSSGDPFVSKHFRRLLFNLDGERNPGLKIQIMTNGLMFNKKSWEQMHRIHKNIERTCVSIDAATEKTYLITRRGGNWMTLMENLKFLAGLRLRNELSFLRLDFVVQDHNYREMPAFVELGKKFGVDQTFFQKITNWGTFSDQELDQRMVYKSSHQEFKQFQEVLAHPLLKDRIVNPGNLGDLLKVQKSFNLFNAFYHSFRKRWRKFKRMAEIKV